MKRTAFLLPLFLLLDGCTPPQALPPQIAQPQLPLAQIKITPECAENWVCAARAKEPQILAIAKNRAARKGDDLILTFANGKTRTLHDENAKCDAGPDGCQKFTLLDAMPATHFLVVQESHYEGGYFLLIDDTAGREIQLQGEPVFSPDGSKFLVAPYDDENDAGDNNLEIWQRRGDSAARVWQHTFKDVFREEPRLRQPYQTRVVNWTPDDHITLDLWADYPENGRHWSGTLIRNGTVWTLSAKRPAP